MSSTHLKKFSQTFFKNTSASDTSQVVAASANITVYKQGVTVASSGTVTTAVGGVAVSVRHCGRIEVNDTVQLNTDDTSQMLCTEVTSETSIKLQSTTGSSIAVAAGDRLVIYSDLPTLYSESTGASSTANPTTTNSRGLAQFYTSENVVDIIFSGSGLTTTLYPNEVSGSTTGQVGTDRGDASVTLVHMTDTEIQRFATTLTANRTITLSETDAQPGAHFRVIRTGLGAFTLNVGGLVTVPPATSAMVDVHYDGADWRLTGYADGSAESVGSDVGDANVTLTHLSSAPTQRYATTLTANRTVTLSATNAVNGARFRIVRTGLGAFTLDVGGLKTIASATAAFVDVQHDGTAWRLAAYGAL